MKHLYVIATPIGNISEISQRAINAFTNTQIVYCEDTRVTKKLFNLLNIDYKNKKFISVTGFNEQDIVDKIPLNSNEISCLVSDAGYPSISDPGYCIVNFAIKNSVKIEIINGPSAFTHALVASGFSTNNFYYLGFLSNKFSKLLEQLMEVKKIKTTIIIYESVHRIIDTLKNIKNVFSSQVKIVVAKELTKMNETIYRGSINEIINTINLHGEFVIVIDNNVELLDNSNENDLNSYLVEVKKLISKNNSDKMACKMVAYKYNVKSKDLFNALQVKKNII